MFDRRLIRAVLLVVVFAVPTPAAASAHAELQASSPEAGAQLAAAPARVTLRFDEPVETTLSAVKVVDARGHEVQAGTPFHPGGDTTGLAVRLRTGPGARGAFAVRFRVVAADDGHRTAGAIGFSVGPAAEAAAAPVAAPPDDGGRGAAAALDVARAVEHTAIAIGVGVLAVIVLVWLPALTGDGWESASECFACRARRILAAAAVAGCAGAVVALPLQAAAIDTDLSHVLATRFGTVWALAALAWLAVLALVLGNHSFARPGWLAGVALPLLWVSLVPALSGHASTEDPAALMLLANVAHVAAAGAWIGGIATLLLTLPAAGRRVSDAARPQLFTAVLARFSVLALAAVCIVVAGGAVQSLVELHGVSDLARTPFGREVSVKVLLVAALVACGALNRRRHLPSLASGTAAFDALRRTLGVELGLGMAALALSAALAATGP